jgi:DNA-binding GntR family transcriptional regulator
MNFKRFFDNDCLKEERLVDVYPQKASYISLIDLDLAEEGFFLREVTENAVLRIACKALDLQTVSSFRENLELQRLAVNENSDKTRFLILDNAFHALIFKAAKKNWTWETVNHVTTHFDRIRYFDHKQGTLHLQKIVSQHQEIFNLLLTGGAIDVAKIVHEHLTGYRNNLPRLLVEYSSYFKQHP